MSEPSFVHLRVHSAYSLLEGAIHIKDLVKWAKAEKMPAVAIADHANLFGSLEFSLAAMESGIQPIMATILYLQPKIEAKPGQHARPDQLLAIAKNETGWKNLLALSSLSYLEPVNGNAPQLSMKQLAEHTEGLIILTGGIHGSTGKSLLAGRDAQAEAHLLELASLFPGHLYIELMRHGMAQERQIEGRLLDLAYKHHLPIVATNDAYFMREEQFEAHDAFLCIADGSYVSEDNRRRLTPEHRLKSAEEMQKIFADLPEALVNSVHIAKRCSFVAKSHAPMLPNFSKDGISEADLLREEARSGLDVRIRDHAIQNTAAYRERLEFEIETIINMKFPGYFLIVSDFIKWSKAQGIPVGPGRGSGAGSLVAWALSITDLDPLRYGLLFERFLNPQRVSMPDFDIDFCQDRREEVIHYVQQKYGRERVAQIITFGKLQARAVLRDVGRVLQMPYPQVDRICKLVPANPANPVTLAEAIEIEPALKANIEQDETVSKLVDISLKLEGLNRHASTHAAGLVIGDRPLSELVPLYRDPKSEMPVVQYSMKYAESAGLVKFDFLGLKTLSVLVAAVKMIAQKGIAIDLLKLPEGDPKTYALLGKGDAVGVFQMESAGMRDTLKKLKPDCLEDLIALVSLYRPGPMDNIPTYIARKHRHEKPEYLHPLLEKVLTETFGVIIYQEQVMQIAQLLAGYSLGEADLLRRAMGKKIKSEMEAQRDIFVSRAVERGIEKAQAKSIFDLIAKFAEYGFNKSHAAAYAVIAYQTAYLKANHPVEFYAASMN
ncbi:MAG: DNA polymerase III subunit alpha, partial [Rickettsiales bacterium]|nr:DNA polymerase III subunit alpha [Rickettsiales bacterium]